MLHEARDGDKKTVKFNLNNKGEKAYNYIDHAYAISDYKSQGATTKRIIWHAPTDRPDFEQFILCCNY